MDRKRKPSPFPPECFVSFDIICSVVKRLNTSKIKVLVYIIYVRVLCRRRKYRVTVYKLNVQILSQTPFTKKGSYNSTTLQGKTTSSQGKTTSSQGKTTSLQGKTTSLQGKTTSSQGKTTSLQGKTTSSQGKTTSSQGKTTSLQGKQGKTSHKVNNEFTR